jgi:hypothetical protein
VPAVGEDREQVTLAVPPTDTLTLDGHDTRREDGDVMLKLMLPEKPDRLETVTGSVPEDPALKDTDEGPDKLKSEMVTLRATLWLKEPLVPEMTSVYCPAGRPAPHVGY